MLHPRPRSSSRPTEWSRAARSDAGGRIPSRRVRVIYRYPNVDSPARNGRHGAVLLIVTLIGSPVLLVLGGSALKGDDSLNDYLGATLAFAFVAWWWYVSVANVGRAIRASGRREVRGVAVDRHIRTFRHWETREPYDIYFLGVDHGNGDECRGWDVPHEVYEAAPDGTPVEVVVSGDGRYLYTFTTNPID
jgi:hypothetical protein